MMQMTIATSIDERRWESVVRHDKTADGAFVYAVSSTGVYCRPSCPSRRPHRERVVFYERAAPKLGMSPSTYRRGGEGMDIRFEIVDSPLGRLLVAATGRGLCAVCMGDSDAELEERLSSEYHGATIARDTGALTRWTR